jgi:hypothetical protein
MNKIEFMWIKMILCDLFFICMYKVYEIYMNLCEWSN